MTPSPQRVEEIHVELFSLGDNTPLKVIKTIYEVAFKDMELMWHEKERKLIEECKKELKAKDKRLAHLESEVTRVFEPTRSMWDEEQKKERQSLKDALLDMANGCYKGRSFTAMGQHIVDALSKHQELINKLREESP